MIPILFPANATTFTSNGLGRLPDAVECTVSEERNGPYELFLRYPITGQHYSDIAISRIICAVPADGRAMQPFRIYRMEKPLDGIVSIYAEHISYELNHIPVMPFAASSCAEALTRMVVYSAQDNPFTVWTDKSVSGNFKLEHPEQFRALLGGIQGSILDVYGKGEYEFDGHTVKLHVNRGTDSGVVLRYGKDITSLKQDENIETTITGVCPYWQDLQTGTTVTLPEKAVWSATAANYPYKRTAVIDFSGEFEEAPTVAQLRARANQYITDNDIGIPKISLDVEFVPLRQMQGVSIGNPTRTLVLPATVDGNTLRDLGGTVSGDTVTLEDAYWDITYDDYKVLSRIRLCDTVTIRYDALGVNATAKVVKAVYNVLTDRYDSLEIGDARTSLAEQIVGIDNTINETISGEVGALQKYVDHQTSLITGGLGGYVVLNYNAAGQPEEILIMDTDDMTTAVNVIRMNKNGIGFSTSGYAGPFTSAWTIDGHFNADFISAGTIDANLIQTGTMLANRILGGTLKLGGSGNGNGVLQVVDANDNVIGTLDNTGANLTGNIVLSSNRVQEAVANTYTYVATGGDTVPNVTWSQIYAVTQTFYDSNGYAIARGSTLMTNAADANKIFNESKVTNKPRYERTVAINVDKTDVTAAGAPTSGYIFLERLSTSSYSMRFNNISGSSSLFSFTMASNYMSFYGSSTALSLSLTQAGEIRMQTETGTYLSVIGTNNTGYNSRAVCYSKGSKPFDFYITTTGYTHAQVFGNELQFASSSSRRYKHDIAPLDEDRDPHRLLKLEAKQFVFNEDFNRLQYRDLRGKTVPGFIAEDVAEIYPSAAIRNPDGEVESWDERRIIPGMLALIQEQQKRLDAQEARIAKLEKLIEEMGK